MSLTRADLVTYAAEVYVDLAEFAGIDSGDTVAGHKLPIDQTMRKMGLAAGAVIADELEEDAYALLDYYSLLRLSKRLASRRDVDVSGAGGASFKRRTERTQLREDLEDARKIVEALGYSVSGEGFKSGEILLDYLEPGNGY